MCLPACVPPPAAAPVQLLGLPTHPIITSLALPIGGQLQLNGLQLQGHEGDDSGEDGTQVCSSGLLVCWKQPAAATALLGLGLVFAHR